MKEKIIRAFVLALLSMFGFRSFLPEMFSSILIAFITIAGLIGCYYYLRSLKNKHGIVR